MKLDHSVSPNSFAGPLLTVLLTIPLLLLACSSAQPDESGAATNESSVTADVERMQRNDDGSYEVTCRDGRVEHDVSVAAIKAGDLCNAPPAESCTSYATCDACAATADCKWCDGACAKLGASCVRTALTPSECSIGGIVSSNGSSSGASAECTWAERTDWYSCWRACPYVSGGALPYREERKACSIVDAQQQIQRADTHCVVSDCRYDFPNCIDFPQLPACQH